MAKIDTPKYDAKQLMDEALRLVIKAPAGKTAHMVMPVCLPLDTKMNRVRFSPEDRTSPMGNIIKKDPWATIALQTESACARFDCAEMVRWLAPRVNPQ